MKRVKRRNEAFHRLLADDADPGMYVSGEYLNSKEGGEIRPLVF